MLKVINLRKKFGGVEVLKGISFEVKSGETAVVLGKSGAGKTTLIRCINGLETFDSGEIIIDGKEVKNIDDMKKVKGDIAMVFQNFNLFPHMTVMENITAAPINVYGIDKQQAEKNAIELLEMVDMADKKDYYPYQLSGGQKQRVAIARSCAINPKILCFDEPTSALDHENIQNIVAIIEKCKTRKMAILIITHDLAFSQEVADNIIHIKDGYITELEEKKQQNIQQTQKPS